MENDKLINDLLRMSEMNSMSLWKRDVCKRAADALSIPAVDAVEVRHGHYVGEYDGYADGNPVYDMWYCSECGCYFEDWDEMPTYKYCPECGARMDGDGDV